MNPPQKPPRKPSRGGPERPSMLQTSGYATLSNSDVQVQGHALQATSLMGGGRRLSTNPFDDDDANDTVEVNFSLESTATASTVDSPMSPNSSTAAAAGTGRSMNKRRQQLRSLIGIAKSEGFVEEKKEVTSVDRYDDLTIIRFLTNERVYGYPGTKGTFMSNFWQFVLNSHPLLSILFVHPLHPFTRMKRIIVFLCSFSFAIAVSFIFVSTDYVPDLAMCRDGCENVSYATKNGNSVKMCDYSYRDSISYSDYHDKCRYFRPWQLTAISGIIIVIFGLFLKFIATCSCLQGKAAFQEGGSNRGGQESSCSCCSIGFWCRKLVEACGGLILTMSSGNC